MTSERRKMPAGESYDPMDPEPVDARSRARDPCQALDATREADREADREARRGILRELCGPAAQVCTARHPFDAALRRRQEFGEPVEIGSGAWAGGGALIPPGVRIGSRAVIGAGSVVTRDVPEGVFAAGNPCRAIREIEA